MTLANETRSPLQNADRFYIGGEWVQPSSNSMIDVIDSASEELYFSIAEAQAADMDRAIAAAKQAFDEGPWPRMSHAERAGYMRALSKELQARVDVLADLWPRESGVLAKVAGPASFGASMAIDYYAGLADTFAFEEPADPSSGGGYGLLVREPVGVVGAIIPWNAPLSLAIYKIAPAFLAGCTVILKASPEAPGSAYVLAEAAEAAGIPAGVFNVVTADREVSELLVRDPRVDKIAFTGSTAAGPAHRLHLRRAHRALHARTRRQVRRGHPRRRRPEPGRHDHRRRRMLPVRARCARRSPGWSSAAIVTTSSSKPSPACSPRSRSATRSTPRPRWARWRCPVSATGSKASSPRVSTRAPSSSPAAGDPSTSSAATTSSRPSSPTSTTASTIAREEIFGPVLSVIPADDEKQAVRIANDTIYGLNASVFTADVDRARQVAGQLRSGTVGHNSFRTDFGIAFGGFKQSGMGREGGREGLLPYLETKTVILESAPGGTG